MSPRTMILIGVAGLAVAAALVAGLARQLGVKSYGMPTGQVVRAGKDLAVLIETCDPYLPSLKGVDESRKSYSYALWLIPERCDGETRVIGLDRGVRSGDRMHARGVHWYEQGVAWAGMGELRGVDVASGEIVTQAPPVGLVNAPISQLMPRDQRPLEEYRSGGVVLASGLRLVMANEDEEKVELKPGKRLYENPDMGGSFKARRLSSVSVEAGPIPKVASAARVGSAEFRGGSLMRGGRGKGVVRFDNPEGVLVVHMGGDAVHPSLRLSRVNADGTVSWTADTKIGDVSQILWHDTLPAFVGQLPHELTEPMVAVVDLTDGSVRTRSLKGPVN